MALILLSTILLSIPYEINAGWPITEPNSTTHGRDAKINRVPYNMIDAFPSCYWRGLCPMFPPGGELSAFPNSEEKVKHVMHNMFRMFPNESLEIVWGKWTLGANKNWGRTKYCGAACDYCGTTSPDRKPLYWYSDANQAARFKQYDETSCDQNWYKQTGIGAHHTCNWVLPEYGGGSHCDLFGNSCTFASRSSAFTNEDDAWFETEGICGANTCYTDSHCEPIFANKYDYQGTGFVEGMNGASAVYSRFTDEIYYKLYAGAHLDERLRIVPEDYNVDGKYFVLMAMYFDVNKTDHLDKCWSLYDGNYHEMDVELSDNPDYADGYKADSHNVMLSSHHNPPINTCEPYAFICKTQSGEFLRLPEDKRYYMGTEWLDWEWSDYQNDWNLYCRENHYFNNGQQWIVNGDPKLDKCDVWYYQNETFSECIGCPKIPQLDCWQDCIYSDFDTAICSACNSITGTRYGNEYCAPGWTASPTNKPTKTPTKSPNLVTSNPSKRPTMSPTNDPVIDPTNSPSTDSPTIQPSNTPTMNPSIAPTIKPTMNPTTTQPSLSPTMRPSRSPLRAGETNHPTPDPTPEPTDFPTIHPTLIPSMNPSYDPTFAPSMPLLSTQTSSSSPSISTTPFSFDTDNETDSPTIFPTLSPSIIYPVDSPEIDGKGVSFLETTMGIVAIAGIAAGVVLCIVVLLILWCCVKRKKSTKPMDSTNIYQTNDIIQRASIIDEPAQNRQSIVKTQSYENENVNTIPNTMLVSVAEEKEQEKDVVNEIIQEYQQSLKTDGTTLNATNVIAAEDEEYEYYEDENGDYEYYYDKDGNGAGGDEQYEYYEYEE